MTPLHISATDDVYLTNGTLHAPAPRSDSRFQSDSEVYSHAAHEPHTSPTRHLTPLQRDITHNTEAKPKFPQQPSLLDGYPQLMFPTPSELLNDLAAQDDAAISSDNKHESQRKARQRALAESVGFTPTDP